MKLISKIIIIGVISLVFVACSKEKQNIDGLNPTTQSEDRDIIDQNKYPSISVQDGVLSFETMDYFQSIVSMESENYSVETLSDYLISTRFKSYGKKMNGNSDYEDSFMDAIMNEDKVVKIGEWFIYIDVPSETVLAISDKEQNAYSSLLANSSSAIQKFSIGDDVLVHLTNNTSANSESCGGVEGGTYYCYPTNIPFSSPVLSTNIYGNVTRLFPYAQFRRYGVYFRLTSGYTISFFSSASAQRGSILTSLGFQDAKISEVQMFIRYPQGWWKKKPCNAGSIGTKSGGFHYASTLGNDKRNVYSGTRNLNGYYFYVQGRVKYTNGTYSNASFYGGRNINSPY